MTTKMATPMIPEQRDPNEMTWQEVKEMGLEPAPSDIDDRDE